jgi:hypothetical protein
VLHRHISIATVLLRCLYLFLSASVWLGCRGASDAPNPNAYRWPDTLTYRLDYVSLAQRDQVPLMRYAETKTVRMTERNGQFIGAYDSVLKSTQRPNEGLVLVPYLAEDTLVFFLKLGAHGEISDVSLGCDPTVPACAQALPSTVLLEMRRIVPRLPLFPAPEAGGWTDTLPFDDSARDRGTRGSVVTSYTGRRDTVISGRAYWLIGWRSIRRAFRAGAGADPGLGATQPVEESGVTLVDKERLIPVYSTWAGAVPAPPELRAAGATGSGFRGRAYLAGTVFDSLYSREITP